MTVRCQRSQRERLSSNVSFQSGRSGGRERRSRVCGFQLHHDLAVVNTFCHVRLDVRLLLSSQGPCFYDSEISVQTMPICPQQVITEVSCGLNVYVATRLNEIFPIGVIFPIRVLGSRAKFGSSSPHLPASKQPRETSVLVPPKPSPTRIFA